MRTVVDTAKQITALISKLSLKSPQPVIAKLPELVDIHALVEEVVAPMRDAAIVPIRVNGGPVGLVLGLREQIHQVLLNVVLNAQQAIDQNGSISITIKELGNLVHVTVEDTGNGIPSHMLETLFRPSQSWRASGLGIGLYQVNRLSKRTMERYKFGASQERERKYESSFPCTVLPKPKPTNWVCPMKTLPTLLLVDDDPEIREQMKWALASDYQLLEASDRPSALNVVRQAMAHIILLDLGLSYTDGASEGLAVLSETLQLDPLAKVIVLTGNSDRSKAIAAIESGAYDFIEKPVQLDILKVVLQRANYLSNLEREKLALQKQNGENQLEGFVGDTPQLENVVRMVRRVGPLDVPVLITGESGTGKELVARAVHGQSARSSGAFVAINCGAIPETLLESELFGYEKGAFTGAVQQRKGRVISKARKAVRCSSTKSVTCHKGCKSSYSDSCRTTRYNDWVARNRSPLTLGSLQPLTSIYKRLLMKAGFETISTSGSAWSVLPSLHFERGSDIILLARTFLLRFSSELKKPIKGFTPQAVEALSSYGWPGNVRELENRVKRAVVMAEGGYVTPENLELQDTVSSVDGSTLKASRDHREKELVRLALEKAEGNVTRAASSA